MEFPRASLVGNTLWCFRKVGSELFLKIREDGDDDFLLFCDGVTTTPGGGMRIPGRVTIPVIPLPFEEREPEHDKRKDIDIVVALMLADEL
jgi:hypothetical protein